MLSCHSPAKNTDVNSKERCVQSQVSVMPSSRLHPCNAPDNYDHGLLGLAYTPSNVPGRGADVELFDSVISQGCLCADGKCDVESSCVCISSHGANYSAGRLLPNKFAGPVIECGSACLCCQDKCENRLVQRGPWTGLKTFQAPNGKGLGLLTTCPIPSRSFICEYAGEIIDLSEAVVRWQRDEQGDAVNFVLVLNEHRADGTLRTCVDPSTIGNIGRYANHSCQPNSAIVPVRFEDLVPKFALFATRQIEADEEITFDYGDGQVNDPGVTTSKKCFCGETNCRGFLPFNKELS